MPIQTVTKTRDFPVNADHYVPSTKKFVAGFTSESPNDSDMILVGGGYDFTPLDANLQRRDARFRAYTSSPGPMNRWYVEGESDVPGTLHIIGHYAKVTE